MSMSQQLRRSRNVERKHLKADGKQLLKDVANGDVSINQRERGCYVVNFVAWIIDFREQIIEGA